MKDNESSQGGSFTASNVSLVSAAAARFARHSTSSRHDSPPLSASASRYRIVTDSPGPTEEAPLHVTAQAAGIPTSPVGGLGVKPMSKNPPLLRRQATEKGSKSPVRFADLVRQASGMKLESDADPSLGVSRSPSQRSKLPQKIRSSVSRMRSQLSLFSGNAASSNNAVTSPDGKAKPQRSSGVSRAGSSPTNAAVAGGSTSPSSRARYSRQSQEMSSKQAEKNTDRRASSMAAMRKSMKSQRSEHSINADATTVLQFMELLRPLQSSMSSLRDEGGDSSPSDSGDDDDDEEEADALFRRHERESSRILRICCSLDNLLFAIADEVQDHKHDVVAVATGPARRLVELIFNGINQIAEAMADTQTEDGMPSLTAKDERYLREFLVEIADRWSKLDELLRGVFVSTLQCTRHELSELQVAHNEVKEQKQALELEMLELREFHSRENAATMGVTSNFMRLADHKHSKQKGPETEDDERLAEYDVKEQRGESAGGEKQTADEEIETLKAQCSEYGRLLEMAKQEIRLTHQERQSQHARLVELSQSLLKDEEVAQLRNELQAEKKRVKMLEMEGLRMRECQVDLNLKIQSLQINQHGPGSTAKQSGVKSSTASTPHVLSRATSGEIRPAVIISGSLDAQTPSADDKATANTHSTAQSVSSEPASLTSQGHPISAPLDTAVRSRPSSRASPWLARVLETTVKIGVSAAMDEDDGLVRLFLANLLMTERELEAAAAQAKLRKKSNVPTLGAPPRSATAAASSPAKKKKKKNAGGPQDPNLVVVSVEEWVSDTVVVGSVRQLIWTLYEQYLMAEETRRVLYPHRVQWYRDSASTHSPPSLASYVVHYFLERHPSEEGALRSLRRFLTVLSKLRGEYGDVRLFCEFLEGSRGREELHFALWTLQAVDAVNLGVNYDDSAQGALPPDSRQGRCVCTLKALYLTRMVYRLLHVKSLKKPSPASPSKVASAKTKALPAAPVAAPTTSPKKRRKSRPTSAGAASTAINQSSLISLPAVVDHPDVVAPESVIDRAKATYSNAVQANSGYPLTLEAFNAILLGFAVPPSRQELLDRLGAFYQPTGDERKISLDVFLVLLSETFATQLQWRKVQLQALFVRLAKEEEVEKLLAAKKVQDELDAEAAVAAAAAAKKTGGQAKEKPKKDVAKSKKRERRVGIDKSSDRHLKGLSRERFRQFLVQGGIINDACGVQQRDFDALYVAILEVNNETPSDIHFDQVYDALLRFEMLGNDGFAVDFTAWLADDAMGSTRTNEVASSAGGTTDRDQQIVDTWRMLSVQTLTVTENDPNMFVRHVTRELIRRVKSALNDCSRRRERSLVSDMEAVQAVQDCLRFAYNVASRRVRVPTGGNKSRSLESCLTEFFYLNQVVKLMIADGSHYASTVDLALTNALPVCEVDPLAVFYDCRFVDLRDCGELTTSVKDADKIKQDLQHVLQRYALFIAHLFESYSLARFTGVNISGGLTRDQWLAMGRDVGLLNDQLLTASKLESLFVSSAAQTNDATLKPLPATKLTLSSDEFVIDKPQFVSLLVNTAVQWYHVCVQSKLKGRRKAKRLVALPSVAQVADRFCQCVVAPHAFHHRNRLQQEDFQRQLSCPLAIRVLLEHRAFLRQLFFHFAKCEDSGGDNEAVREVKEVAVMRAVDEFEEPRRVKTKRNSMVLAQFMRFLQEYHLYEAISKPAASFELRLDEAGSQRLFQAAMAIESDDTTCMEFDEFTTAVAAIAVLRKPHPFVRLHVKIDAFVGELRAIHASTRDRERSHRVGR